MFSHKRVLKIWGFILNLLRNLFASVLSTNNHWALGKNVKRIENVGYQDSRGRYHDRGKRILWSFAVNRFCLLESIGKSDWKWPLLCSSTGLGSIWFEWSKAWILHWWCNDPFSKWNFISFLYLSTIMLTEFPEDERKTIKQNKKFDNLFVPAHSNHCGLFYEGRGKTWVISVNFEK